MKKKLILTVLVLLSISVLLYSLKSRISPAQLVDSTFVLNKVRVTSSFYPLYYFTSQVGGDKVSVLNLTPAGVEPHDYEPTSQDIANIEQSQLLVLNGGLEPWADRVAQNLKEKPIKIIKVAQELETEKLAEGGKELKDPHVWLSPPVAKQEVSKISQALQAVDPANSAYYRENEGNITLRLDKLASLYYQGLSHCQKRDIVTSHSAFGYLARDYGLNQISIAGLSPDAEPSPKQLIDVVKFVKQNQIKYIFVERLISPKLSETIATETGAQTLVLDPLEGLTSEDMKMGSDYFTKMQDNLDNLKKALECT